VSPLAIRIPLTSIRAANMQIDIEDWLLRADQAGTREQKIGLLVHAFELVRDEIRNGCAEPDWPLTGSATSECNEGSEPTASPPVFRAPVELEGWYGWPVHCPFCGASIGGEQLNNGQMCRHLLYVAGLGCFHYLSERLAKAAGISSWEDPWAFADTNIDRQLGGMDRFLAAAEVFPNSIRFRDCSPIDVGEVAFAAYSDELHVWGQKPRNPKSP